MNRRILLADDSLTIQKVVELTFADTDFDVFPVSSGDELIARLPEVRPDIVICDIIMPGRDGYDVCQTIKSSSEYLHLPVVLLTGTFEPFDRDRALAVGCSEIITKPFEAKRLVEAVEKLTSDGGASHRPIQPSGGTAEFDDGRVTPPPPIEAPDVLVDVEADYDFADTAITAESGPVEPALEAPDEGLDFTESGFTDMVNAGREQANKKLAPPTEGLDFELDADNQEATEAGDGSILDTTDFSQQEIDTEESFVAEADDPFAPPPDELAGTWREPMEAEPFPTADDEPVFEEPAQEPDLDRNLTTPINVAEAMKEAEPLPLETGEDRAASPDDQVDFSNADTQDFGKPQEPETEVTSSSDTSSSLSDHDIDRIARRVLELAGDRIDHIAWEVLPDMAEIVVRERVREIEAEVEREHS